MDQEEEKTELIFVYGSLRRCGEKAYLLADAEFVCPALVQGTLYEISNSAALVMASTGGFVAGELFRINPASSDKIAAAELPENAEGSPRKVLAKIRRYNLSQADIDAWVWEWSGPVEQAKVLEKGDWIEHRVPREAPSFTVIAMVFLLALPMGMVPLGMASSGWKMSPAAFALAWGIGILGLISPPMGLAALFFADRRRERWRAIRPLLYAFLAMASIPTLVFMANVFHALLNSLG